MEGGFETTRERIARLLREVERPLTVDEIISMLQLNATPREVYEDLLHLAKSIHAKSGGSEVLLMEPPRCRKCGYVFKDLGRPRKPSRCPRCKSEWIEPPRFIISRR
ncbi:transcriptional regulator [Desulfurococcus mucosus]|uniref:Transcriptional regulator consisting of an HTH domain fused to a Zn-ribbon n=1 Tax=Desulfurococcus mucosus (strain ATCC 35584 / DSM 2162 / JCM 9187 / O7/1) TaxID=765177 RepID=E8R9I8_DESM0|nr:transcriptional regulator [Desulfurococcus mucosus]ADV65164.1 transcriptional regulator consisting of an HTH domain fused to a Zn-ribbon [Desulfurococcus mucosus DSM 2162]